MKNKIKAEAIANEICMGKKYHKHVIVLVEGLTDKTFFNKFVETKCYIKDAYGKQKVIKAIPIIKERMPHLAIFGIVDSDFYRLDNINLNSDILITDTHDLETMIIKTKALDHALKDYANDEKLKSFFEENSDDIRETLLKSSLWIGYLLWISQKEFPLKFNELIYKNFIDHGNLELNLDNFIIEILSKNGNCQFNAQILKIKLKEVFDPTHDKWQICRGHDIIKILIIGLQHIFGICECKKLNEQELHDIIESELIKSLSQK